MDQSRLAGEILAALARPQGAEAPPVKPTPPPAGASAATVTAYEVADQQWLDHIMTLPASALSQEQKDDLGRALGAWCRENRR